MFTKIVGTAVKVFKAIPGAQSAHGPGNLGKMFVY
jgi:hypothetical protein